MTILERLKLRTGEADSQLLADISESAKSAILTRRYACVPVEKWPDEVPVQYADLQFRIAMDLYNKIGAEGQIGHSENGVSRTYESSWISRQLLLEIIPLVGVPK